MMDGDHGIFVLAYAVVASETRDVWICFCSLLKQAINRIGAEILAIRFRYCRDKGLLDSLSETFPECSSIFCKTKEYSMNH